MIAAAIDLQVGAAGEGGANAQNEFAGAGGGDRNVLDAKILLAAKDRGSHGSFRRRKFNGQMCGGGHLSIFSSLEPCGRCG